VGAQLCGIELLGLDGLSHPGIERDAMGRPTGRLYGMDEWLRDRWAGPPPDLATVGAELLGYGITGVTDATATTRAEDAELLAGAVASGTIPQHVQLTGGLDLDPGAAPSLRRGPVKLMVADYDLPGLDDLAASIAAAHRRARPVALHCVTRVALVLAQAAWDQAGVAKGDRLERGAVVPLDPAVWLAERGVVVVTQPIFVVERGDQYLTDVDAEDLPYLWPCRSLVEAGVALVASSDGPLGHPDPWAGLAAAITRRTARGRILGAGDQLAPGPRSTCTWPRSTTPVGRLGGSPPAARLIWSCWMPPSGRAAGASAGHVVLTFRAGRLRGPDS
jgi:predicted amidohydrolase YtcJ